MMGVWAATNDERLTTDLGRLSSKQKGHSGKGWPLLLGRIVPTGKNPLKLSGEIL
jgi:hypothetical protein